MNRIFLLGGSIMLGMLLSQGALAGGWQPYHPPGWGPMQNWMPYRSYPPTPYYGAPWMRPGYGPRAPHWGASHGGQTAAPMAKPGYQAGGGAPAQGMAPSEPAAAPAGTVADNARVTISQMRYGPTTVTVKKGGTVTWTQRDGMPHTVTAVDGSFDSGRLSAGGEFSQTFDSVGTFAYYCTLHPSMRGEVVVVE